MLLRVTAGRAVATVPACRPTCTSPSTRSAPSPGSPAGGCAPSPRSAPSRSTGGPSPCDCSTPASTTTRTALALTGTDVCTPILHFQPPEGVACFGPVLSGLPDDAQAVELWDHVVGLARPGFAELKRSLRELPQLRALGVAEGEVGVQEDW